MTTTGQPHYVSGSVELNRAIQQANDQDASGTYVISVQKSGFNLTENCVAINTKGTVTIQSTSGKSVTLDGQNTYGGFIILSGKVTLQNLNIKNMCVNAPDGCMGAGAGLFVANFLPTSSAYYNVVGRQPTVILNNVSFSNCAANGGGSIGVLSGGASGAAGTFGSFSGGPGGGGSSGVVPVGSRFMGASPLPAPNTSSYFGMVGAGGTGGGRGGGGRGFPLGNGNPGGLGDPGRAGGYGGYGASSGNGGGGGGGGGGGYGGAGPGGGFGGSGGPGGGLSSPGFGGGSGAPATPAQPGTPPSYPGNNVMEGSNGGPGGAGGGGATGGGGAGFGGGLFAMDNANIRIVGTGSTSGNKVIGGPNAAAAGQGIFLQGSGCLHFNLLNGAVFTIADGISDETGAVAQHSTTAAQVVAGCIGPDGLPTGGGTGIWDAEVTGNGKLTITGNNYLSGDITVSGACLDISNCPRTNCHTMVIKDFAALVHRSAKESKSMAYAITIEEGGRLLLNGNTRIFAKSVTMPAAGFHIEIDPAGFENDKSVEVLNTVDPMNRTVPVTVNEGFSISMGERAISVTKEA
ncbi:hypothetical protein [Phenylobacterium sp.]|uniref:hypothetical protein n=1 Tax=Phenylobacterium sp. TaxID=1871053 RepID=UPI0025F75692|nr:hypothetical protein [Phenylobacterium sp.]MCA6359305.1 hypothetical protein [Phenylobacterium sp.]